MENILRINIENSIENPPPAQGMVENRIEALKALATLLLREVESLQPATQTTGRPNSADKINLSDEVHRFESALIRDALIRAKGHQRRAARILGTKVTTLNAKIKRYGIESYALVSKF